MLQSQKRLEVVKFNLRMAKPVTWNFYYHFSGLKESKLFPHTDTMGRTSKGNCRHKINHNIQKCIWHYPVFIYFVVHLMQTSAMPHNWKTLTVFSNYVKNLTIEQCFSLSQTCAVPLSTVLSIWELSSRTHFPI